MLESILRSFARSYGRALGRSAARRTSLLAIPVLILVVVLGLAEVTTGGAVSHWFGSLDAEHWARLLLH